MTDQREQLIDKAATVAAERAWGLPWLTIPAAHREAYLKDTRIAFAVFEEANTPSDDEREALATRYARESGDSQTRVDFLAGWDARARIDRTVQGELAVAQRSLTNLQAQVRGASRQMDRDARWLLRWVEDAEAGGVDADALSSLRARVQESAISVQGEPSDAAVRAGAYVLDEGAMDAPEDYPLAFEAAMSTARDVLIAAAATEGGER